MQLDFSSFSGGVDCFSVLRILLHVGFGGSVGSFDGGGIREGRENLVRADILTL